MVDISREGKFELLALTVTKVKGNRKISWWVCVCVWLVVSVWRYKRVKERRKVWEFNWLMSGSTVVGFGCVCFRILLVKFKFTGFKMLVVELYDLCERDDE